MLLGNFFQSIILFIFLFINFTNYIPKVNALSLFNSFLGSSNNSKQDDWSIKPGVIPEYVLKYAPMVHLYSEERYLPYHVGKFVHHFRLTKNDKNITFPGSDQNPLNLKTLGNFRRDSKLTLTSNSDFSLDPDWLTGIKNSPDPETNYCKAPAILIVVDKKNGWVDAFWFYFYSFNLGPFVMGDGPFGNHIGDWEHSLVRFHKGKPKVVWMSAHGGGAAYKFSATEKYKNDKNRPIIYSARGTHANYATPGKHPHDLPYGILSDFTDRGPLWDPAKNHLSYTYDGTYVYTNTSDEIAGDDPNWLLFTGRWGDKKLAPSDYRQRYHPFEWRYIDGPTGPLTKNIYRIGVCQRSKWYNIFGMCRVRNSLDQGLGLASQFIDKVRPVFVSRVCEIILWKGWIVTIIDRVFG